MPLGLYVDLTFHVLGSGSFAAQTLLELADNQDNVHLASDFGSLPQDSHDLLLEDVLEEDEELPGDQQEMGVGAEAIGDDTTDLDLSATGTTKNVNNSVVKNLLKHGK